MTGSYHSLLLFFLLACSFVSRDISFIYDVRVCVGGCGGVGGGGGLDVERDRSSFFEGVSCLALLLSLLSGLYRVHRFSCVQPLSRCTHTVLASSFFFFPLFSSTMRFYLFFPLAYWPFRTRLLACLIWAAILHFSFRLHLFTSRCFVIGRPD